MSSEVAGYAGCLEDVGPAMTVSVRGMDEPMSVIGVARGRDLPASILSSDDEDDKAPARGGRKGADAAM